jgi:hypothetical protein
VRPDVAHVVPHALGKYPDLDASPFYQLVKFMFPARWDDVCNLSSDAAVNGRKNLVVLAPTYHRMYDLGTLRFEPDFEWHVYRPRFLYQKPTLPHTRRATYHSCVEVRDGGVVNAWNELGDPRLHMVMSRFRRAIYTFRFTPREAGERRDLGPFFAGQVSCGITSHLFRFIYETHPTTNFYQTAGISGARKWTGAFLSRSTRPCGDGAIRFCGVSQSS